MATRLATNRSPKALPSEGRTRNSQSVKNIKRIDSTKTHGWQVHVRRGGVLKTKLFSDRVYAGKRRALKAAKEYRDSLLKDMADLAKPLWKIDREPKTNTGELGCSYTEYVNRSGKVRGVITVTVRAALGKPVNRKFSVSKLGRDEALRQAVEWRNQVLRDREQRELTGAPLIAARGRKRRKSPAYKVAPKTEANS